MHWLRLSIFTVWRYVSAVYTVVLCLSVCLCVRHTLLLCQSAKRRITQTTQHDSPETLVFSRQNLLRNSNGVTKQGRQMQVEYVKIGHFRRITRFIYLSKNDQDAKVPGCASYYFWLIWYRVFYLQLMHLINLCAWLALMGSCLCMLQQCSLCRKTVLDFPVILCEQIHSFLIYRQQWTCAFVHNNNKSV